MVCVIFVPQPLIPITDLISILVLPSLPQYITDRADKWGETGRIDPFTEVYEVSLFGNVLCWGWS